MVMNTEIEQYERIQEYLRGRMSDEERAAFEKDLTIDDSLREQYDDLSLLERSINKANQEADLRIALEETEKQLSNSPDANSNESIINTELLQVEQELRAIGVSVEEPQKSGIRLYKEKVMLLMQSILQWFTPTRDLPTEIVSGTSVIYSLSYASRMVISFAVAVCLALAIILPHNASLASSGFNYAPSQLEFRTYRGDASDMIEKSVNSYNNGDYDSALSYLEESKKGIEISLSQLGDSDSDIIAKQNLTNELYQVDWYRALTLMKVKRVKDAKNALRSIAESDSPYSDDARAILNDVY